VRVAVAAARCSGDEPIDPDHETNPVGDAATPAGLVELQLAIVRRAEGVRSFLERREAYPAVQLPVVGSETPDFSGQSRKVLASSLA